MKLSIKSDVCLLCKNYTGIKLNGTTIGDLIEKHLPQLETGKSYPVKVNIQIEFLGEEGLIFTAEGYEIKEEESEEENE